MFTNHSTRSEGERGRRSQDVAPGGVGDEAVTVSNGASLRDVIELGSSVIDRIFVRGW